ncbi:ferritin-like domain-containing protein [Hymenobacter sp. BT683]|uniref:Ferritin-like domain-containing protein n=1 Tax=Hymenobacter jeongseonensis TaxID=2791027 RepID=A0ABS0IMW9_9BACT|nr:ferritin-like domain-containing protein [Hymenobacter jeongseonensis]MBF9239135.1 ferritin-like domain-containing protein [Hymenobacter jeongseonensis]
MSDSFFSRSGALHRRTFLRVAGASAATASLVLAGCSDTEPTPVVVDPNLLQLAQADPGLLNYLYLLKQLQTAFYQKVVDAFPSDFSAAEKLAFNDLRDHELVHRETLRFMLGANAYDTALLQPLPFDFSSLTLTSRAGVLAGAQQLEDLSVAAYAGSLRLLAAVPTAALLAKIASVEARHAAFVRDLRTPGSFADTDVVVSEGALQSVSLAKTPTQVLDETKAFFLPVVVSPSSLPTA